MPTKTRKPFDPAIASNQQLANRYDRIIRQCLKDGEGGLDFGMDWPTLRVLWPDRYAEIQTIKTEARKRRAEGRM